MGPVNSLKRCSAFKSASVLRIEIVPGIAGAIHHNVCIRFTLGFGCRANRTARSR
jgi:hypothetical protein